MKYTAFFSFFITATLISACSGNRANHLPSPIELPGAIIGSVIENATYGTKRRRVESYVAKNYLAIRNDARRGGGRVLDGAINVAGIKGAKRNRAKNDLINNQAVYFHHIDNVVDNLIHNFTALYVSRTKVDKRINGFTYTEARNVISVYANQNFEALRVAVQQGSGSALEELALRLNIKDASKKLVFKQRAKSLYKTIYLELVTVVLMVNS